MSDESLYVRQDAQWSIEKTCRMKMGTLGDWLDLEADPDIEAGQIAENKRKVEEWWEVNRRFIENNYIFE